MDRATKTDLVAHFHEVFSKTSVVVVTHYTGLTVAEATKLRRQMRDAGASFKVTKNRLTRRALAGTPYEALQDMFVGQTAIAYSDDPVAAAKASSDFAKANEKLVILGGAMGETLLDADGVKALAALPSLDELRGKLVGLIQAPATKVAGVIQAPAGQLARVFAAYGAKEEQAA